MTEDDNEIVFTRLFDAPPALVYKVFTDPRHLAQWWGPHGFSNPVCEVDLRPGGAYRIVMRGPDGAEYPLKGVYLGIVENERLVMTDSTEEHPAEWHEQLNQYRESEGQAAQELRWTVTFEEHGGGTKLSIRTLFASAVDRDAFMKMGMADGWSQSLERLEAFLAKA